MNASSAAVCSVILWYINPRWYSDGTYLRCALARVCAFVCVRVHSGGLVRLVERQRLLEHLDRLHVPAAPRPRRAARAELRREVCDIPT